MIQPKISVETVCYNVVNASYRLIYNVIVIWKKF